MKKNERLPMLVDINNYMTLRAELGDDEADALIGEIMEILTRHNAPHHQFFDAVELAMSLKNMSELGLADIFTHHP